MVSLHPDRVHPHVEQVVDIVGRQAELADRFAERVLTIGTRHDAILALAGGRIAPRAEQIGNVVSDMWCIAIIGR